MHMRRLHLEHQIQSGHGRRDEEKVAPNLRDRDVGQAHAAVFRNFDQRKNVLDVDEADGIVQRLAIDRQA